MTDTVGICPWKLFHCGIIPEVCCDWVLLNMWKLLLSLIELKELVNKFLLMELKELVNEF